MHIDIATNGTAAVVGLHEELKVGDPTRPVKPYEDSRPAAIKWIPTEQ